MDKRLAKEIVAEVLTFRDCRYRVPETVGDPVIKEFLSLGWRPREREEEYILKYVLSKVPGTTPEVVRTIIPIVVRGMEVSGGYTISIGGSPEVERMKEIRRKIALPEINPEFIEAMACYVMSRLTPLREDEFEGKVMEILSSPDREAEELGNLIGRYPEYSGVLERINKTWKP